MKKIVTIVGARPQFVKAAILSRIIKKGGKINEVLVHTGQHFDANMSAIFFNEMQIPQPKYNLDVNTLSHAKMTAQMLEKIEAVLLKENPEAVVVYGDTNSTLAGALAAKKMGIKVIHIEAGLRSFNMNMPEEVNRIVTDSISDLLLCPTDLAVTNLKNEGQELKGHKIVKSGDIMKDAVEFYSELSANRSKIIEQLKLESKPFVLATIHREDNCTNNKNLKSIFEALEEISKDCRVIMPLHPRTRKALENNKLSYDIGLIDPVGYFDMLQLLKHCKLVFTDSGGLQKEAFFNNKACVIIRQETEWLELVEHGFAKLVGHDKAKIIAASKHFMSLDLNFNRNLYGQNVGEKIYSEILKII